MGILIIEDDPELARQISQFFENNGLSAQTEERGDRGAERICAERPSLVVLDLSLPGMDGLSVCRKVRPAYGGPILMLTARGDESDEVAGLELGADDYLAKPVRPRVLLARVRALLRRHAREPQQLLSIGDLEIDPTAREVSIGGAALPLTSGEFDLLWLLASQAGRVLSREELYRKLTGGAYDELDRAVDLRVSRLRQKLEARRPGVEIIKTVRGVGYQFFWR